MNFHLQGMVNSYLLGSSSTFINNNGLGWNLWEAMTGSFDYIFQIGGSESFSNITSNDQRNFNK